MRSIEDVGSDLLHFHVGIQYVGIFKNDSTNICKYFKSRERELEAKYEDLAESARLRWHARLSLKHNLGKPLCSFTQYEKVIRLTFYYGDYMILMKVKPIDDYNRLIDRIGKKVKGTRTFHA